MTNTILTLPNDDDLQVSDLFAIWDTNNSVSRKTSLNTLLAFMQANLTFPDENAVVQFATQYAAPSATGFNVQITGTNSNIWLILTPTAGFAAGTITLPSVATLADKQEILVNCTQAVSTLTISLNGAAGAVGAPSALTANAFFRLKYDLPTTNWYRVG